jgi:hypothetical protein
MSTIIEPVYDDMVDVDVLPTSCKVDDSVYGFITSLSSEENFVRSEQQGVFWQLFARHFSYKDFSMFDKQKRSKVFFKENLAGAPPFHLG